MNKRTEWIGWWAVIVAFVISTYYSVIIAWAISYSIFTLNLSWGSNPEAFLYKAYLNHVDPGTIGSLVPDVLIPLIIVWVLLLSALYNGVYLGIEIASRILIIALALVFVLMDIR